MSTLFYLVIIANILSLGFLYVNLSRFHTLLKKSHFEESKYTLLFGFVHAGMYQFCYIVTVLAFSILLTLFTLSFS